MAKILIVEDDLSFGTLIQTWLRKKGFEVEKATSVKGALLLLEKDGDRDLILSDFRLPDHDGLAVLKWAQDHNLRIPFIVMTSYAEVQNAVLAMKAGATDYIAKPFQPDILLEKIQEALRAHASSQPPTPLSDASAPAAQPTNGTTEGGDTVPRYIEGKSEASRRLYDFVSLVAPTPMSVLILGASGTGKEYVARRIHELSPRADKPFFALDCGAIPREVAASEFFGYVKGAFTGADQDKKGAFETANGGTLQLAGLKATGMPALTPPAIGTPVTLSFNGSGFTIAGTTGTPVKPARAAGRSGVAGCSANSRSRATRHRSCAIAASSALRTSS